MIISILLIILSFECYFVEGFKHVKFLRSYNSLTNRQKLHLSSEEKLGQFYEILRTLEYYCKSNAEVNIPSEAFQSGYHNNLIHNSFELADSATSVVPWGLFSTTFTGPEILSYLDIANLFFLPKSLHDLLVSFPVIVRLGFGVLAIDLIPLVIELTLFKGLWSTFLAVKLDKYSDEGLPKYYDEKVIESFYQKRPRLVLSRFFELFGKWKGLAIDVLQDILKGEFFDNAEKRGPLLKQLIAESGPTFIKIGQTLSTRSDLCPPGYLKELVKLQDQVPPFSSVEALKIIEREYEKSPAQVFASAKSFEKPVAAASLGQVYKAKLLDGQEVAVKVQRPNMKLSITLDLYIVRKVLEFLKLIPRISEECQAFILVLDNWGSRFIDELDYGKEVENCERFRNEMTASSTTLGDAIVIPKMYKEYCTPSVLVSQWIEGSKLSKIDKTTEAGKATVRKLTRVLLNCYLVQLLETGFLHADPHPGNFLVTSKGKVCILDYGLMTEVAEYRQIALLEYVSHLLAKDYDATLDDLVTLGFIPPAIQEDPEQRELVAPLLAKVLSQLSSGGGMAGMNIAELGKEIDSLSMDYPIIIPAYFGLIIRSFGALEGLGLSVDKDYSIVKECFPYLANRLLSDDSERVRLALRTFLYGDKGRLDVQRLDDIAEGYRMFSMTAADAASGKALEELRFQSDTEEYVEVDGEKVYIDPVVSSAVKILFSAQGNYVQQIILDEAVRITEALSRSVFSTVASLPSSFLPNVDNLNAGDLTLQHMLNPLFPLSIIAKKMEQMSEPSPEDLESLKTLKRLLQILAGIDRSPDAKAAVNKMSTGKIDAEDLALVAQVIGKISTSLPTPSLLSFIPTDLNPTSPDFLVKLWEQQKTNIIRNQILELLPLLRESFPGAAKLMKLFGRKLLSRSLGAIADRIDYRDQPPKSLPESR